MRIVAFDIGKRRTGAAFLDDSIGIPLPLDTLTHTSEEELIVSLVTLARERRADRIVVGLPRLPSGDEGEQAAFSRKMGEALTAHGFPVQFIDERYTTPSNRAHKHALPTSKIDGDAAAACALLSGKITI